jgi:hypothetical protein
METSKKHKGRKKGSTNANNLIRVSLTNTEWVMVLMALRSVSPNPMDILTDKIHGQVSKAVESRKATTQAEYDRRALAGLANESLGESNE